MTQTHPIRFYYDLCESALTSGVGCCNACFESDRDAGLHEVVHWASIRDALNLDEHFHARPAPPVRADVS